MKSVTRSALLAFATAFATAFAALPCLAGADNVTPMTAKGVQVVSVEQARSLLGKAPFFDVRSPVNYGRGHIKDSVALPYEQKSERVESFDASKDKFDKTRLPADKALPIVFYGGGPTGWKPYKAAILAARDGYASVKWMREGTAGWVEKGGALE